MVSTTVVVEFGSRVRCLVMLVICREAAAVVMCRAVQHFCDYGALFKLYQFSHTRYQPFTHVGIGIIVFSAFE